jgi:hypothetical protein
MDELTDLLTPGATFLLLIGVLIFGWLAATIQVGGVNAVSSFVVGLMMVSILVVVVLRLLE